MPSRTSIKRVVRVSDVVLTNVGGGGGGAVGLVVTGVGAVIGAPTVCGFEQAPSVMATRTATAGALNRRTQAANATRNPATNWRVVSSVSRPLSSKRSAAFGMMTS